MAFVNRMVALVLTLGLAGSALGQQQKWDIDITDTFRYTFTKRHVLVPT